MTSQRYSEPRRAVGGPREVALFAAAYFVYTAARWIFKGDASHAYAHARWVMQIEQAVGIAFERSVQRSFAGVWMWGLSNLYLAAQLAVVPGALIWLYRRDRSRYRTLRTTMVVTWLLSVPIFALFPVAPPRLADAEIVDTVSQQAGVALTGHSTLFYNPLAAVPSLHVGFAFATGLAVLTAVRASWAKTLALAWGALVTLAVLATGNHYVVDAVAGLMITGAGFAIGQLYLPKGAL
jgi:hypothetical protein